MGDDIGGRGRLVIADIVDRAGPRPLDRGQQYAREILDVNAREHLAWLVDALGGAGAQRIERAAPGAVDRGEAKNMARRAVFTPEIEPARFGRDSPPAEAG